MSLTVSCPFCRQALSVIPTAVAQVAACPRCRQPITIAPQSFQSDPLGFVSDATTMRRRQPQSSLGWVVGLVALVAAVSVAGGVVWAVRSQDRQATQTTAPVEKTATHPNPTLARQKSNPPGPKVDDQAWVLEAKLEYYAALKEREREQSEAQIRLGSMSRAEFEFAANSLKLIQEKGIENASQEAVDAAARIAPGFVRARLRENGLAAEPPNLYPKAERQRRYAEFARAMGIKDGWALGSKFDLLTIPEMEVLSEALVKYQGGGLGKLTKPERLMLLKAGGDAPFKSLIK